MSHVSLAELSQVADEDADLAQFTIASIQDCLRVSGHWDSGTVTIEQTGSARCGTNTDKSDVDVLIYASSELQLSDSTLSERYEEWRNFQSKVISTIGSTFGARYLNTSRKCVNLDGHPDFPEVDLLTRIHRQTNDSETVEFWTHDDPPVHIVDYPFEHRRHAHGKGDRTQGASKALVRALKRTKAILVADGDVNPSKAYSYHIECAVSNIPDSIFETGAFDDSFKWLLNASQDGSQFKTALMRNKKLALYGNNTLQWNPKDATHFYEKASELLSVKPD